MIANIFFALAVLVLAYSIFLGLLSLRDGKFRSGIYAVPTVLAPVAGSAGSHNCKLFLAIAALDFDSLLAFSRTRRRQALPPRKPSPPAKK